MSRLLSSSVLPRHIRAGPANVTVKLREGGVVGSVAPSSVIRVYLLNLDGDTLARQVMTDWSAWSQEAVALAQARNEAWQSRFGLVDARYAWDLERGEIVFQRALDDVVANLCLMGTIAGGAFVWAWANDSIPVTATGRIELVRAFGYEHELTLLTTPSFPSDRAKGLELLAVAARVQDAEGAFLDSTDDAVVLFTLWNFRVRSRNEAG